MAYCGRLGTSSRTICWQGLRALTSTSAGVRGQSNTWAVKFELTEQSRQALEDYLRASGKKPGEFLFTVHCGAVRVWHDPT